MKKAYIAGKMTGLPMFNFPAFDAAAAHINKIGIKAVNPADIDREKGTDPNKGSTSIKKIVRNDLNALQQCDMVFVLPGWKTSLGAKAEVGVAHWLGIPVFLYSKDIGRGTQVVRIYPARSRAGYETETESQDSYQLRPKRGGWKAQDAAPFASSVGARKNRSGS